MADLIIAGNGFDLAHKMKTGYGNFRDFLIDKHPDIVESLEYYSLLSPQELWSDFENNLSKLDLDTLSYSTSLATQKGTNDDEYSSGEDDGSSYFLSGELGFIHAWSELIEEWITDYVEIPQVTIFKKQLISDDNLYLSFNYTETLEYSYGISDNRVFHIHGRCGYTTSLLMGHGDIKIIDALKKEIPDYSLEPKRNSIIQSFITYLKASFKDVKSIIQDYRQYLALYCGVENVHIIGFSFNDLDIPYIDTVFNNLKKDSEVYVYYHNDEALKSYTKKLCERYPNKKITYYDISSIKE